MTGSLSGLRVLLDGYNLELRQGTGISTYGLTLLRALRHLGAEVSVLCSSKSSRDPVLAEVLLFDALRERPPSGLLGLLGVARAVPGVFKRPVPLAIGGSVKRVSAGAFFEEMAKSVSLYTLGECYRIAGNLHRLFGVQTVIRNPGGVHVWHATCPLPIKIRGAKQITTIHDLIPLRFPHLTFDDKKGFYGAVRSALRESDLVLCVSESTKRDVLEYFDVNPDKLRVVYQPIALDQPKLLPEQVAAGLKRFNLQPRSYLLFVGSIEPRKNVKGLAEAYATLDTEMPLVLVGKQHKVWEQEGKKLASIKNVRLLEYVGAQDLACLYAGAYVLVFPSFYEGFGLPPLEAMTFGCPVITSNVSSLPELYGEAALYVEPSSVTDIAEKIRQVLADPALRDQLAAAGLERARRFSTERYVREVFSAYQTVLGRVGV